MPGVGQAQAMSGSASSAASADPPVVSRGLLGRLPFSRFEASQDSYGRAYSLQMKPIDHGRLTTAIEYRLSPHGPIGSLGLQTARDGPDIPARDVNSAAALGLRGPEAKVGARISYHF